ncbi:RNA binding protein-like protein, partial [Leishmania panamensis]
MWDAQKRGRTDVSPTRLPSLCLSQQTRVSRSKAFLSHARTHARLSFHLFFSSVAFGSSTAKVVPFAYPHHHGCAAPPPPLFPTIMQEFHAFSVSPSTEHRLDIPEGCGFHLSIISLPRGANGKTTVYVSADGKSYALASLDSQKNILQVPLDLIFNYRQHVIFFAKGSATVHCVGYRQELDLSDDDDDGMENGSDDDASDAEKAAMRLPVDAITDAGTAKKKAAAAATERFSEDEDENENEELIDSAEDSSADAASDDGFNGKEMEEDEEGDSDEEDDEEYDDDDEEIDSDIAEEPAGMQARDEDPTAPSSEDEEESNDDKYDEESDDLAAMEEDDDENEKDEEEKEPPMKAMRSEGRPS